MDLRRRALRLLLAMVTAASAMGCVADVDEDEEEDDPIAEDAQALKTGKVIVGIADSDPDTFDGAAWNDLGLDWARRVVPWNVALLPDGCKVRSEFVSYIRKARATKTRIAIMFGPDAGGDPTKGPTSGARERAPKVQDYRRAMAAFVEEFPGRRVLAPWNEPDFADGPRVEDLNAPLHKRPKRAADYYVELKRACKGCLVLAGEFASNPAHREEYWEPYRKRLEERGVARPEVWSIHPTTDLFLFAAHAADPSDGRRCTRATMGGCVTKTFATWVAGLPGRANVWLTETEAPFFYPGNDLLQKKFNRLPAARRESIQADAMRFLFREVVKSHANVTRVFIYPLRERPRENDAGLLATNGRREAYGVVRRYAR